MSTIGADGIIDLQNIDPNLLRGPVTKTSEGISTVGGSLISSAVGPDEVVPADEEKIDVNEVIKTTGLDTTLLSAATDETADSTAEITSIDGATSDAAIDVESVKPDFTLDPDWQSTGFDSDESNWTENTDGTFTQNLDINLGGRFGTKNVSYDFTKDGGFIGVSDGSKTSITGSTQVEALASASGEGSIEGENLDNTIDSNSTINTEPLELNNGNLAYGFDSNGDGELDTYRIEDGTGAEVETISADQFTGVDYAGLNAVPASTDETFINMATNLGEDHVWNSGSEDLNGDGIPDGITDMDGEGNGLMATLVTEHTFADGSKGFKYQLPNSFITGMNQEPLFFFNENGQIVDSEGKALTDQIAGSEDSDSSDGTGDTVGDTGLTQDEYDTVKTTLGTILVNTGSDTTDALVGYYDTISGLFATGEDGSLTEEDQVKLTAFWNTMIDQGETTGVIMSSKTMGDYFELVKEYTGQYNGTIAPDDVDQFLTDWLANSILFTSTLDGSQKWSENNITDHSQYSGFANLIRLLYGEGRELTGAEAMRYLTDVSYKDESGEWIYGVGGSLMTDSSLGTTAFLVRNLVLNATGDDQEYVTSYWLANDSLDLSQYDLTLEEIAEIWGVSVEELKAKTAAAKKDKKKKQSTGSFFAPKDVVRIGDEDPNATKQGQTRGPNFRNKTRTASLLGGSVNKKTLVGS